MKSKNLQLIHYHSIDPLLVETTGTSWKFTSKGFDFLVKNNLLIQGGNGGLVIGDSHEAGGVMLTNLTNKKSLIVTSEIEGGEFLIRPDIYQDHMGEIVDINNDFHNSPNLSSVLLPGVKYQVINASVQDKSKFIHSKVIVIGPEPYFVVNKRSTSKHLDRLVQLNKK